MKNFSVLLLLSALVASIFTGCLRAKPPVASNAAPESSLASGTSSGSKSAPGSSAGGDTVASASPKDTGAVSVG